MLYQLLEAESFVVKTLASKANVARKPIALLTFIMVCYTILSVNCDYFLKQH
jgi:hypothetical protein